MFHVERAKAVSSMVLCTGIGNVSRGTSEGNAMLKYLAIVLRYLVVCRAKLFSYDMLMYLVC